MSSSSSSPYRRSSYATTLSAPDADFDDAGHERWVPPSDRQLALRARLNSGWSVHTNRHTQKKSEKEKLTWEEEEAILEIIKRAKESDEREKVRIGMLVDRLENIKRNSHGNGREECALCACPFGLFKAKPHECHDCKSNACGVCSSELERLNREKVWLCKICSETRALWKFSGAWFLSDLPPFVMPAKRKSRPPPSADRDVAETTTTTTKWRTTTMPTPAKIENRTSKDISSSSSSSSNEDPGKMASAFVKDKKYGGNAKSSYSVKYVRVQSRPSSSSSSDDDDDNRKKDVEKNTRSERNSSPLLSPRSSPRPGRSPRSSPGSSPGPSPRSSPKSSPRAKNRSKKSSRHNPSQTSSHLPFNTGIVTDYTSLNFDGRREAEKDGDEGGGSVNDDRALRPLSDPDEPILNGNDFSTPSPNFQRKNSSRRRFKRAPIKFPQNPEPEDMKDVNSVADPKESLPVARSGPSSFFSRGRSAAALNSLADEMAQRSNEQKNTDLGTLEFSLLYDEELERLIVKVIRGHGLKPMDYNGLSDPYVKLHLLPGATRSTKLRTKTIYKTLNPDWSETLIYHGISDLDKTNRIVRLAVLDEDSIGYEFIGETLIPLRTLEPGQEQEFHRTLCRHLAEGPDDDSLRSPERGRLQLSLHHDDKENVLYVGILRCAQIKPSDFNGFADPYVVLSMEPVVVERRPVHRKFKTSVKKKNLNPLFDEVFAFQQVQASDLAKRSLEISVWDKDFGNFDDYIGGVSIGIHSKGARLRQWLDVMRHPDQQFVYWHRLAPHLRQ